MSLASRAASTQGQARRRFAAWSLATTRSAASSRESFGQRVLERARDGAKGGLMQDVVRIGYRAPGRGEPFLHLSDIGLMFEGIGCGGGSGNVWMKRATQFGGHT